MKIITLLSLFFCALQSFSQSRVDKFLVYRKTVMPFTYVGDSISHNDTLFVLYNFLSVRKSRSLMNVMDPKYGSLATENQKWKFERSGNFVKLRRKRNNRL